MEHIRRVHVQASVWKQGVDLDPVIPNPLELGWQQQNVRLVPVPSKETPAPDAVLQLMRCRCASTERTCSGRCLQTPQSCLHRALPLSEMGTDVTIHNSLELDKMRKRSNTGEPSSVIEVNKNINSMIFIKDSVLAVGSDQPKIVLYSTTSGKRLASLEGHSNRVKGLAMSPDHNLLFSASSDGTIKVWTVAKLLGGCKCVCSVDTGSRLTCITVLLPDKQGKQPHKEEEKRGRVEEMEGEEEEIREREKEEEIIEEERDEEVEENREREEEEGKEEEIKQEREEEVEENREKEEVQDGEEIKDQERVVMVKRRKKDKSRLSVRDNVQEENAVGGDTERDRKRRKTSAVGKRKSKRISSRTTQL